MKKLALLGIMMLSLQGCMMLDAYLMAHYDGTEYQAITDIRAFASVYKTQCGDAIKSRENARDIANKTQYFEFYEQRIPHNNEGWSAAKKLNEIAQALTDRYENTNKVSKVYCELKFGGIEKSSDLIQNTIGNRPR